VQVFLAAKSMVVEASGPDGSLPPSNVIGRGGASRLDPADDEWERIARAVSKSRKTGFLALVAVVT
jgi:hypothetical protein